MRSVSTATLLLLASLLLPPGASAQGACASHVSDLTGDDVSGDGSQTSPFQSIGAGIADVVVRCSGLGEVRVGEGDYPEHVVLTEGIDLLGGHQCDLGGCSWARDADLYQSTISNQQLGGVLAGSTLTRATRLDGFRIVGVSGNPGSGGVTAAVTLDEGTPTVSDNRIVGGDALGCSPCKTAGIQVRGTPNDPAGALISANTIEAGDSSSAAYGIDLFGSGGDAPVAAIEGNVITGGTAGFSRAVLAQSTGPGTSLIDNRLTAGSGSGSFGTAFAVAAFFGEVTIDRNRINEDQPGVGSCTTTATWCGGIEVVAATATITSNVVFGLSAPRSAGVFLTDEEAAFGTVILNANSIDGGGENASAGTSTSTAIACRTSFPPTTTGVVGRIRNNILQGGIGDDRFGFYEDTQTVGKTCQPEVYEFNALSSVDFFHRQWTSGGSEVLLSTISQVNQLSYAGNNLDLDCGADATFHLPPGSLCVDAGVLTEAPALDIDGQPRPQGSGIDIGADELVPTVPGLSRGAWVLLVVALAAVGAQTCSPSRRSDASRALPRGS